MNKRIIPFQDLERIAKTTITHKFPGLSDSDADLIGYIFAKVLDAENKK